MMAKTDLIRLLLVEDNDYDAELTHEMLIEANIEHSLRHAKTIKEAQFYLDSTEDFDLILLDLNLPDSHGLETIKKVAYADRLLPIVVLTGEDNEELSYLAIQAGAQDYLIKGKMDLAILKRTIYHSCYRFQLVNKINADTKQQKAFLATHDILTSLPNEQIFLEQLQHTIAKYEASKRTFAIILLKVHEMAMIEQHFGPFTRDKLLKAIANCLQKEPKELMTAFRFKETIFGLILTKIESIDFLSAYINSIQHKLNFKMLIEDREYFPLYSIGSAIYPFDGEDAKEILTSAFSSLERAEEGGYNKFEIYDKQVDLKSTSTILHSDILNALEHKEFLVYYQPQLNLRTGKLFGTEALLRWKRPGFGLINPDIFIPMAEEHKLITPIGEWVIHSVCSQLLAWEKRLGKKTCVCIDINISIQQLEFSNLYQYIKMMLTKFNIDPKCLSLELTESVFLAEPESVIKKLKGLKAFGLKIAIDDFGKGYSSLSYLNHLPVDYLKLDRIFLQDLPLSREKQSIVKSIIQLAHDLEIEVIAEGVETEEQYQWLKFNYCDAIQGPYYSKPKLAGEIEPLL